METTTSRSPLESLDIFGERDLLGHAGRVGEPRPAGLGTLALGRP